jgi:HEAT repeat protein
MGLFDRFSKEGREQSSVEKNTKAVLNKHKQSADRFAALEKLRDIGTDEALHGMVRRFSYNYDKTIEDEQEKEWVAKTLISLGDKALAPLRKYIKDATSLSYPLRVLGQIGTPEQILATIDEVIAREEPGYTRDPARKLQVLGWLSEWNGASAAEIARRAVPYLADFDGDVRFAAIETLSNHLDEASSRAPLLDALVRPEEEHRRIKLRAAEVLAAAGWQVTSHKEKVSGLLGSTLPDYGMQNDRLVRKGK